MQLGTHLTGGILAYTLSATLFQIPLTPAGLVLAGAASAAPDVDTLGSTVGRTFKPIARRIERRWGHRTITHCYAAQAVVVVACLPLLWWDWPHLYAAVVAGYLSHCFLDTWTVQGVWVFWPWSDVRGVFPYYNRQETAYRTVTGSRVDTFFGVLFLALTIPFAVVQMQGYHRLVRSVQADASAAVRDFLDWSGDGHLVSVSVSASDPEHMRRLEGTYDAIGTTGISTLLVRDPETGETFSLGEAYSANFQPDKVNAHKGEAVTVSRRRADLAGRVIADLENLVPLRSDGSRARHLLDGQLTTTDGEAITPDAFHFNTVTGSGTNLSLQFATLDDLRRLGLLDRIVETGVVSVRVYLPEGEVENYDPAALETGSVRRVPFAHKPSEPPRLLIAEGDTVAQGDTVAVLSPASVQDARLDLTDAQADLSAVLSERAPAADPVSLRARADAARDAAQRKRQQHAGGFASAAAVERAERVSADADAALDQAALRLSDWQRGHAERERKARARVTRAQIKAVQAQSDTYVVSPARGVVARIERHPHGPDRTEVRVVLVEQATRARSSSPSPTDGAGEPSGPNR
jgi:inner membrane protein